MSKMLQLSRVSPHCLWSGTLAHLRKKRLPSKQALESQGPKRSRCETRHQSVPKQPACLLSAKFCMFLVNGGKPQVLHSPGRALNWSWVRWNGLWEGYIMYVVASMTTVTIMFRMRQLSAVPHVVPMFLQGKSCAEAAGRLPPTARQMEVARRAKLVTEALDYLREITSTFMPLPVQAAVDAVASIAAASKHQVPFHKSMFVWPSQQTASTIISNILGCIEHVHYKFSRWSSIGLS